MKMTEKEFRSRLCEAGATVSNHARILALVREAGLEFAPEAPAPPERLVVSADGTLAGPSFPHGQEPAYGCFEASRKTYEGFPDNAHRRAILAEAVRRYNAWPALRAALAELTRQASGLTGCRRPSFPPFAEAIEAAEAALAEAPEGGR